MKVLLTLKAEYKSVTGKDWKPDAHKPAAQEQSKKVQQQSAPPSQMSAGKHRQKCVFYLWVVGERLNVFCTF